MSVKRSKQCPKCESKRIGYLDFQPDANDVVARRGDPATDFTAHMNRSGQVITRALGVSSEPTRGSSGTPAWPLYGKLEAYVCTECGYHETYVADVKKIQWDKLHGFAWLNPDPPPDGPFR